VTLPLERLRFPASRARGRRYPEFAHPYRNDFQRDRDRVVHARAFRRLEGKTQVFAGPVSDHFRNRLTHTIEVSQIARTVASALGLDNDLTEALALAHDMGHPPFAHSGEIELHRLMTRHGEAFEHNLHALRIVESFENPYPRFPGLNLTFEVREGIIKHSRELAPGPHDEYLPGVRPLLEAQLIDLCDEIAYNTADFDDGYDAGMFTIEQARAELPFFDEAWDTADSMYPGAPERVRLQEVLRGLINTMVGGVLEGTIAAAVPFADAEAVRHAPARIATFTPKTAHLSHSLKAFLRDRVYHSDAVRTATQAAVCHMEALFDLLLDDPARMPAAYREASAAEPPHRQVCDYIAGMTDGYFLKTCRSFNLL
jgi:dGTPase